MQRVTNQVGLLLTCPLISTRRPGLTFKGTSPEYGKLYKRQSKAIYCVKMVDVEEWCSVSHHQPH